MICLYNIIKGEPGAVINPTIKRIYSTEDPPSLISLRTCFEGCPGPLANWSRHLNIWKKLGNPRNIIFNLIHMVITTRPVVPSHPRQAVPPPDPFLQNSSHVPLLLVSLCVYNLTVVAGVVFRGNWFQRNELVVLTTNKRWSFYQWSLPLSFCSSCSGISVWCRGTYIIIIISPIHVRNNRRLVIISWLWSFCVTRYVG